MLRGSLSFGRRMSQATAFVVACGTRRLPANAGTPSQRYRENTAFFNKTLTH
jgi:hypothetical protein